MYSRIIRPKFNFFSSSLVKPIRPLANTPKKTTFFRYLAAQNYNFSNLCEKILKESPYLIHENYKNPINPNDLSDIDFIMILSCASDARLKSFLNILPKELRIELLMFADESDGKFVRSKLHLLSKESAKLAQQLLDKKDQEKIKTKTSNTPLSTASFLNDKKALPIEEKINEEVDDIKYTLTS